MVDISIAKKINRRIRMFAEIDFSHVLDKFRTIWILKPYSMIEYPRLASAYDLIFEAEKYNEIEGAIVECGSWNGGYAALMNAASEQCGKKRDIWLFDSFEGLPKPGEVDVTFFGKKGKLSAATGDIRLVEKVFEKVGKDRKHIIAGWFQDTFSKTIPKVGKIAFLHLDCDFYESTKYCLDHLFPLLSKGALVIVDDYSYYLGCKKAVDEFITNEGRNLILVKTVDRSAYFRKV
jgi:hypothetical protein